jgi:hypothetical protein
MSKEPQSYGSQGDWLTGNTGQNVTTEQRNSQRGDFYRSRHDSEESAPHQGGEISPRQRDESERHAAPRRDDIEAVPVQKVSAQETGARRDSFFRKRDYE